MRVLAIEDHELYLDGLRYLLRGLAAEVRLAEASTADKALDALECDGPELDLVLLDLCVPGSKPFELLGLARSLAPQAPAVVLSAKEDRLEVERAFELGAQAYLFKSTPNGELLDSLRRVMQGEVVMPPPFAATRTEAPAPGSLTARQRDVLRLLPAGFSNKEIASELGLAENTVKVHLAQCYRLLGVTNRTAAVRIATRAGLIGDG